MRAKRWRNHETRCTALPACVRMILAYLGRTHTEEELAIAFQTVPHFGTLPENVEPALEALGYHARWFENATLGRLELLLASDWPVIVFLRAFDLPHGRGGYHALVVVEVREE